MQNSAPNAGSRGLGSVRPEGLSVPRVLICGTHRGAGVSTIVFGLVVAYTRQQTSIGAASLGVSLIEPTHFRRISNRLAYTIDPRLLSEEAVLSSLARLSDGTELLILEGNGGLFDDRGPESSFPTLADLAVRTNTPVVLVIDAEGAGESVAALIRGFRDFRSDVTFGGVIANRVSSSDHLERVRKAVESQAGLRLLGGVGQGDPHQMGATLASYRMHNPSALTRNRVIGTGNLIREGVDLEVLKQVGASAKPCVGLSRGETAFQNRRARIAVADDQAFHLTIQDNLDLLRRAGAELVPFSPIADQALPKNCQAVYIPGGYPQLYTADLQANQSLRRSIRQYLENGGLVYAEAGALAYLSRRITTFQGVSYDMVGAFPALASAVYADDVQPELPIETLQATKDNLLGPAGMKIRGMRETRWTYRLETKVSGCFQCESAQSSIEADGFSLLPNVVLTKCYLHWASLPQVAATLLNRAVPSRPA